MTGSETKGYQGQIWRAQGPAGMIPDDVVEPLVRRFQEDHPRDGGAAKQSVFHGKDVLTIEKRHGWETPTVRIQP